MARAAARPLSPHLSIWRWGPHMLVSILHRMTGVMLATVGTLAFVWWLVALAAGPESYASFHYWVVDASAIGDAAGNSGLGTLANLFARLVAIGLTWAFFTHLGNGVRHLVMDIGANYELRGNKRSSVAVIVFGVVATALLWAYILLVKGA